MFMSKSPVTVMFDAQEKLYLSFIADREDRSRASATRWIVRQAMKADALAFEKWRSDPDYNHHNPTVVE